MHCFFKYFHHLWAENSRQWQPMLGIYYLTYACNFRCPYCSDGKNVPYYQLPAKILHGTEVIELLRRVRAYTDFLVITGGEPLLHPDFAYVMEHLPALRFKGVLLTTNAYYLHRYLSVVASAVNYLLVSVDTLHHGKADGWYSVGEGVLSKILENITTAADYPGRRYEIIISAVATPGNIEDLYGVYHYAKERGFRFAVAPQLIGVNVHPDLIDNTQYKRFYDFLMAEKKQGYAININGSLLYLKHMRNFSKFSCRPFTLVTVAPTGDVYYPCLEIGHVAGNLLETPDLHQIRRNGLRVFGPQPKCEASCQSACALGFSLPLGHPLSMLHECCLVAKGWGRKIFTKKSSPGQQV